MPESESRVAEQEIVQLDNFYKRVNGWLDTFKSDPNLAKVTGNLQPSTDSHVRQVDAELMAVLGEYKQFLADFDYTITSVGAVEKVKSSMRSVEAKIRTILKQLTQLKDVPKEIIDARYWLIQWLKNEVFGKNITKSMLFTDDFTPEQFAAWSKEVAALNEKIFSESHV